MKEGKIWKITRECEKKNKEEMKQRLLPRICGLPPSIYVCYLTNPSRCSDTLRTLWLTLSFRPVISDQVGGDRARYISDQSINVILRYFVSTFILHYVTVSVPKLFNITNKSSWIQVKQVFFCVKGENVPYPFPRFCLKFHAINVLTSNLRGTLFGTACIIITAV
jgi:hypothetical protein